MVFQLYQGVMLPLVEEPRRPEKNFGGSNAKK